MGLEPPLQTLVDSSRARLDFSLLVVLHRTSSPDHGAKTSRFPTFHHRMTTQTTFRRHFSAPFRLRCPAFGHHHRRCTGSKQLGPTLIWSCQSPEMPLVLQLETFPSFASVSNLARTYAICMDELTAYCWTTTFFYSLGPSISKQRVHSRLPGWSRCSYLYPSTFTGIALDKQGYAPSMTQ